MENESNTTLERIESLLKAELSLTLRLYEQSEDAVILLHFQQQKQTCHLKPCPLRHARYFPQLSERQRVRKPLQHQL